MADYKLRIVSGGKPITDLPLKRLAEAMTKTVSKPIKVRPLANDNGFECICGEGPILLSAGDAPFTCRCRRVYELSEGE